MTPRNAAPLLAILCACGDATVEPEPLHCGTPSGVTAAALGAATPSSPTIVYLNRCRGGCALTPGPEDARRNTSTIVPAPVVMAEFSGTDQVWNELVDCVTQKFLPFEVVVTDVDPGDVPHFENVVSGRPEFLGLDPTIGGVAPSACGFAVNAISFTFSALSADDPRALCVVAAHEVGHTFGLEHQMLCNDPMTYLPACGEKEFRRVDARCGEHMAVPCECGGGNYQNSYLSLLDVLGPRSEPLNLRPKVRIASPAPGRVEPNFLVNVDAEDDGRIARVRARVAGIDVGTATVSPYVFHTPDGIPLGPTLIEAEATDDQGLIQSASLMVELALPRPQLDASVADVDNGDRPAIIGEHDAGSVDADAVGTLASDGCTCVTTHSRVSFAVVLVALLGWRRRRLAAVMLAALALASCQDEGAFAHASGSLSLDPPPNTALSFEPVMLTRDKERMLRIEATNVGTAPVEISEVSFSGPDAALFDVLDGPGSIGPGASRNIWITFRPTYVVDAHVTLHIATTDAAQAVVEYPVTGIARAPCQLFVTPSQQAFGDFDEREVRIEAAGLSACTITRVSGPGDIFELVDLPAVPFTIASGEAVTLRVRQVTRTRSPGNPVRTLYVFEADGSEAHVRLVGRAPIWDCVEVSPDPRNNHPRETDPPEPQVDLPFAAGVFERRIVVTNRCAQETVRVLSAAVGLGWESFSVDDDQFPVVLAPQASAAIVVHRAGVGGGFGEVHLSTDDAAFGRVTLRMKAPLLGPAHVYVAPSMDFGVIPRGCTSRVRGVTVFNFGASPVRVDRVAASGDPSFVLLSVEMDGAHLDPAQPFDIAPSSSADVLIEARAQDVGELRGRLVVRAGGVEHAVALRAQVVASGPAEDRFTLDIAEKSDVLFVLDDSLSAEGLRQRVRSALPAWVGLDQRVAVTIADPSGGAPSRCLDFERFLESSTLGPAALLRGLVCLMTPLPTPPRIIGGLGAAIRFAEDDGASFLRPDARLSLVMVSDDDDVSAQTPQIAARFFESLKGPDRPDLVAVHDLTTQDPSLCDERFAQRGARYQAVSGATGGLSFEGCASDLRPALQELAAHDHRMIDTFALSRAAVATTLTVTVGGAVVGLDPNDGYSFDAGRNTVTLHGASAAMRGAAVVVQYAPECAPARAAR